ncbi:MAG TPA: hypothetical protein VGL02_32220 [Streptomyces sp.]
MPTTWIAAAIGFVVLGLAAAVALVWFCQTCATWPRRNGGNKP